MTNTVRPGTSNDAEVAVYRQSVLEGFAPLVNLLRQTLGVGIVAKVAGIRETRAVNQWADGQRAVRSRTVEARLRLAYQAVTLLSQEYSPEVAARWFEHPCPLLDYRSPGTALASSSPEVVGQGFMSAAREFLRVVDVAAPTTDRHQEQTEGSKAPEMLGAA
jgi:hypothetical protein